MPDGRFWADHWWLIIILAVFAMPIISIMLRPIDEYLRYRRRRDAMEVLKVYAQQGKEPPPEVLDAIRPSGWSRSWHTNTATVEDMDAAPAENRREARRDARWARQEARWAERAERWERRRPLQRWNGAIFTGGLTAGFGIAAQYAEEGSQNVFLMVAIITGALFAASLVSALLATFLKAD